MIEIVKFGAGFRLDDEGSWGQGASRYLENGWRPVESGVHVLDADFYPGDRLATTKLSVLSDGTARYACVLEPLAQAVMIQAEGFDKTFAQAIVTSNIPINGSRRMQLLTNARLSEIPSSGFGGGCLRLLGIVRYNPEGYSPSV